jgi:hypothetical protein
MKKYEIKNTQYSIQILPSSSSPMASLEDQSQNAVLMPNPTTKPKILDMPQDSTIQNQFKTHLN